MQPLLVQVWCWRNHLSSTNRPGVRGLETESAILLITLFSHVSKRAPRARGDEPFEKLLFSGTPWRSPRTRG
jgi:hypothetical protein